MYLKKTDMKYFSINAKATIKDAMKIIEKGEERICFVVNKKNKILASISDGDIRRAIISGSKLNEKVLNIQKRKPIVCNQTDPYEDLIKKFSKRVNVIPIVNSKGELLSVLRKNDILPFLNIKSKKIVVVGLGYVGLTLAMVLSESGFNVTGYDTNKNLVRKIKKKIPPFYEKGMKDYLDSQIGHNCKIVDNLSNLSADVYILTVGTPFDKKKNKPDLSNLQKSIKNISKLLKKNDLIILRSTVPIGCTRNTVAKYIEKNTKLKFGEDIFLAFCPERTIEGQALQELKRLPQIIGGYCKKSSELSQRLFNEYTYTVIDVESLEAAEFCKLVDNTYRDTIFGYSNQLALLSEKLKLDFNKIIDKANIGYERNRIPKPSPGVGGACLTKDPYILLSSFKSNSLNGNIILSARKTNEKMVDEIFIKSQKILKKMGKNLSKSKIFVSGFAFKGHPETSDYRFSTTLDLLNKLKKKGVKNISGHDFKLTNDDFKSIGVKNTSLDNGFLKSDVVFIMNNHLKYSDLNILKLINKMNKPALFFDSWQLFEPDEIKNIPGIYYTSVGRP